MLLLCIILEELEFVYIVYSSVLHIYSRNNSTIIIINEILQQRRGKKELDL